MFLCLFANISCARKESKAANSLTWVKMKCKIGEMRRGQKEDKSQKGAQSQGWGWHRDCVRGLRRACSGFASELSSRNSKAVLSPRAYGVLRTSVGGCVFIRKCSLATFISARLVFPCTLGDLKSNSLVGINARVWFILRSTAGKCFILSATCSSSNSCHSSSSY